MKNLNVLVGISGGISVYKVVSLVSLLKKAGANVDVVMTQNATKFVGEKTFETLSKNPVSVDTFTIKGSYDVEHVALAQKADIAILAPATANTVAKLACGIADNMLTTVFCALTCPIIIVPAMNTAMYNNIATKVNLQILKDRGFFVTNTGTGLLACGDVGEGRMLEPSEIFEYAQMVLKPKRDFMGKKILITAGPTREPIDPARYISNRSSGKMGYALAREAIKRGAEVTLISGPTDILPPKVTNLINVITAKEMQDAVMQNSNQNIIIMCAAVADYAPKTYSKEKLQKEESLTLELKKTTDILKELGKNKQGYLVGFAAQTHNISEYALKKLEQKNLDMIVANDVSKKETGFESENNAVSIYTKTNKEGVIYNTDTKTNIANNILDEILKNMG